MIVKPLTEHHLELLSLKGGSRGSPKARQSKHVKYHIVGNLMHWLISTFNILTCLNHLKRLLSLLLLIEYASMRFSTELS